MAGRNNTRTIDLNAIRHNVKEIRKAVPASAKLLAVVKADAYGHGAVQTAKAALEAGASWLAVAIPEEGTALRAAGIEAPILVLGPVTKDSAAEGVRSRLTMTVCSRDMVREIAEACRVCGMTADIHLKLDTGMNRIGCRTPEEVRSVLEELRTRPAVHLTGAFTHFADADGADMTFTRQQLQRFRDLTALLPSGILLHCANSAAIHRLMPDAAFGMVRMGISLYGCPPVPTDMDLRPAMRWTAEVTFVKMIHPGDTVSYGRRFEADRPMRVATVSCGYGDGYHRTATGMASVLIRGVRCPVVGRICMDQMIADVTAVPDAEAGDTAVLLGTDGTQSITAEDIAAWAGTISYEILLAATQRVERVWLGE